MSDQAQFPSDPQRPVLPSRPDAERLSPAPSPAVHQGQPITTIERTTLPAEPKDGIREIVETIVFVVVLVLLLKTFLAEAFVIPTGSMATTLLGYHKDVVCDRCGYPFKVNASEEAEKKEIVTEWVCPNCRHHMQLQLQRREGNDP